MQEQGHVTVRSGQDPEGTTAALTAVSLMRSGLGVTSGVVRRRVVMRGGAVLPLGAGVVMVAGCGQGEEPAADSSSQAEAEDEGNEDAEETTEDGGSGYPSSEVPVGGASFDEDSNTVFSQPTKGDFRAFDATCPHQGCSASNFADGRLVCPCHNSMFDPDSGDVVGGPATSGLTAKDVTVSGDDLIVS